MTCATRAAGLAPLLLAVAPTAGWAAFADGVFSFSLTVPDPVVNALGYAGPTLVTTGPVVNASANPDHNALTAAGGGAGPLVTTAGGLVDPFPDFPGQGGPGTVRSAEVRAHALAAALAPGATATAQSEMRAELRFRFLNGTGTGGGAAPAQVIAVPFRLAWDFILDVETNLVMPPDEVASLVVAFDILHDGIGFGVEMPGPFEVAVVSNASDRLTDEDAPPNFLNFAIAIQPGRTMDLQVVATMRARALSTWPPGAPPPPDFPELPPPERVPAPPAAALLGLAAVALAALRRRRVGRSEAPSG